MPGTAARTLACAADLFARLRKLRYEGIAIASRIPMMMITTRSSIRVKPLSSPAARCRKFEIICCSFGCMEVRWLFAYRPFGPDGVAPRGGCPGTRKGAVSRALSNGSARCWLAGAGLDVAGRAGLVVGDR